MIIYLSQAPALKPTRREGAKLSKITANPCEAMMSSNMANIMCHVGQCNGKYRKPYNTDCPSTPIAVKMHVCAVVSPVMAITIEFSEVRIQRREVPCFISIPMLYIVTMSTISCKVPE